MSDYDFIKMQKKLAKYLDENRYEHTLGVMFTCASLAMVHGYDLKNAQVAGLLHDSAKCIPNKKKLKICAEHHIPVSDFEKEHPFLLHAKLGAYIAKAKYNVTDKEILSAITYHTTGKPDMTMLEKIVYLNQKFILPAQKLASLYIKTNQLSKAKEIYDNILLKNKPSAETLHQYAILSSSLCDTDTAEKILKKVIKMNPNIAKAHKDLGIIFLNKRLFDYAEDEFKTAMKLMPNDFEIIFEYGNFLYSVSKNTEAERYYREALDLEPENVLALTFMALNKLILNQLDAAKDYIMKALKINPNHEYIQFCAGRILFARKEFDEAKHYLIHAVEQNPDIETQNTLALTYYELGEYASAINIFNNLLAKKQDNISLLMSLAKCYEGLKDNDRALKYLDKVVTIFPEDEEAHEMIRKLS